ncbi:hypothetical protein [Haloechinothrix sp. LS1_15]|uniref:hypothetical protein n=1 Tax=Haloechinothrix sp. LS1_15 TaxID=2652248 RepID=UPI0029452CF1|nr:hypothetical protein [Haloechinothrix sp. LS1_15]MDV6011835.1 hypothetical protein [Haloechinothrix sp. LS1_15]
MATGNPDTEGRGPFSNAIAALSGQPSLRQLSDYSDECTNPTDGGPEGRYEVGRGYWLDDLPNEKNREYLDTLYTHWEANNYRIRSDNRRPSDEGTSIYVEHNEDAFRMSIRTSDEGDLSLGADSPCIWPEGTLPDDTEPGF